MEELRAHGYEEGPATLDSMLGRMRCPGWTATVLSRCATKMYKLKRAGARALPNARDRLAKFHGKVFQLRQEPAAQRVASA